MITYPLYFDAKVKARGGIEAWESTASPEGEARKIPVSVPKEFEGPGGGFSPEDLYLMALCNCFTATFKVIASRSKLDFSNLEIDSRLTVDRNDKGAPFMKAAHFKVRLQGANDQERALRLLEKTSAQCMILNSVLTQKTFDWDVS